MKSKGRFTRMRGRVRELLTEQASYAILFVSLACWGWYYVLVHSARGQYGPFGPEHTAANIMLAQGRALFLLSVLFLGIRCGLRWMRRLDVFCPSLSRSRSLGRASPASGSVYVGYALVAAFSALARIAGTQLTSPTTAAVVIRTDIFFGLFLSYILLSDRGIFRSTSAGAMTIAAALTAFAAVWLVVAHAKGETIQPRFAGLMWLVVAAIAIAGTNAILRKWRTHWMLVLLSSAAADTVMGGLLSLGAESITGRDLATACLSVAGGVFALVAVGTSLAPLVEHAHWARPGRNRLLTVGSVLFLGAAALLSSFGLLHEWKTLSDASKSGFAWCAVAFALGRITYYIGAPGVPIIATRVIFGGIPTVSMFFEQVQTKELLPWQFWWAALLMFGAVWLVTRATVGVADGNASKAR